MATEPLRIPLWDVRPQFDNDDPRYVPGSPGTYLLLALAYDCLAGPTMRDDRDGIPSPDFRAMKGRLAESWEENADHTWTLRLKSGLRSHHGNELTAESVRWGFEKAFALDTIGAWRWGQVGGIQRAEDVEPVDRHTLRFTLRAPDPHFPAHLFWATPNVLDAEEIGKHATADDPFGMAWMAENVAGFGPYAFASLDEGRLELTARDAYWAGRPPHDRVRLEQVSSREEALTLLDEAAPAICPGLRCDEVRALQRRDDVRLVGTWAGHTSVEIGFHRPPFDDVRVRHALSLATPYQRVIDDGYLGLARPWRAPIKTFSTWYDDSAWSYDTNVERARELMREAGYGDGFTTQLFVQRWKETQRIGEILREAYAEIGIDCEVLPLESAGKGYMPPLHLRVECSHNLTEPLYDLAHDYAAINPIVPAPGGPVGVGTWLPRYVGTRSIEDGYRETLTAPTHAERERRCRALERHIVEFAPNVFLAETPLFNAANAQAHPWASDYDTRHVQVTLFQNSHSRYMST